MINYRKFSSSSASSDGLLDRLELYRACQALGVSALTTEEMDWIFDEYGNPDHTLRFSQFADFLKA